MIFNTMLSCLLVYVLLWDYNPVVLVVHVSVPSGRVGGRRGKTGCFGKNARLAARRFKLNP